jgi:hypothetical protein
LQKDEKKALDSADLDKAEEITHQIKDLREKEILLKNLHMIERNRKEFNRLKKMNDQQIFEFNQKWDQIISDFQDTSRKIEEEFLAQHEMEKKHLNDEIERIEVPPAKFSGELLNSKVKMNNLIKARKYKKAKEMREDVMAREKKELDRWDTEFHERLYKKRDLLLKKQNNEHEALKSKLEKSIGSKLKQRSQEYEK